MWSYWFDTAIRRNSLLYYSRTNTIICVNGIQQMLYQGIVPTQFLVLYFMQGFIQKIRATNKHKKWQFSGKKTVFSFWVVFKKKTALSTFTTFQESSSGKWAHTLLVKCLSNYIIVETFVISVVFNVFSLSMVWSRLLLRVFIWIWIDVYWH